MSVVQEVKNCTNGGVCTTLSICHFDCKMQIRFLENAYYCIVITQERNYPSAQHPWNVNECNASYLNKIRPVLSQV